MRESEYPSPSKHPRTPLKFAFDEMGDFCKNIPFHRRFIFLLTFTLVAYATIFQKSVQAILGVLKKQD
jgi:hypothetical protein